MCYFRFTAHYQNEKEAKENQTETRMNSQRIIKSKYQIERDKGGLIQARKLKEIDK